MRLRSVRYTSHFTRAMKRLPAELGPIVDERIEIFKQNCFDPRLRTHKLRGARQGKYSFSVTHSHRIVFVFESEAVVVFLDVGDHSIYQ